MKTTKILSTALLLTIMLALGTNVNAQSARYGGTAYVYAEDRDGNKVVLNAAAEYLYSSESEVKSALFKATAIRALRIHFRSAVFHRKMGQ